jgi:hypothetical protein
MIPAAIRSSRDPMKTTTVENVVTVKRATDLWLLEKYFDMSHAFPGSFDFDKKMDQSVRALMT